MRKNEPPNAPIRGYRIAVTRCCLALLVALTACADRASRTSNRGESTSADAAVSTVPTPGLAVGPVLLTEYCEARARVGCHRLSVCGPVTLSSRYRDPMRCEAVLTEDCERSFVEALAGQLADWGLVEWDPELMGAALTTFSRRHCNTALGAPSPFVAVRGLLEDGVDCRDDPMCRSGFCAPVSGSGCGRCAPRTTTPPMQCPEQCGLAEQCRCSSDDAGLSCRCTAALAVDDDCSADPTRCDEGLVCVSTGTGASRVSRCRPLFGEGGPCGPATGLVGCAGEAYCDQEPGGTGTCRAPALVAAGAACDTVAMLCPSGRDCRGVCVARADEGESCTRRNQTTIPDGGPPLCRAGPCRGTCQAPQTTNNGCVEPLECAMELGCYLSGLGGGSCQTWEQVRMEAERLFVCP